MEVSEQKSDRSDYVHCKRLWLPCGGKPKQGGGGRLQGKIGRPVRGLL